MPNQLVSCPVPKATADKPAEPSSPERVVGTSSSPWTRTMRAIKSNISTATQSGPPQRSCQRSVRSVLPMRTAATAATQQATAKRGA